MDRFTGRFLLPWLRFTVRPPDAAEQLETAERAVCYVMGRDSTLDGMVLQRACARAGLPRAGKRLLPRRVPQAPALPAGAVAQGGILESAAGPPSAAGLARSAGGGASAIRVST